MPNTRPYSAQGDRDKSHDIKEFGGALAIRGSWVLTCWGGTLLLRLMRVKWRLQGDTDGLAKVGDAEDDEYHPLPPVEVPEHLKHDAALRRDVDASAALTTAEIFGIKLCFSACLATT